MKSCYVYYTDDIPTNNVSPKVNELPPYFEAGCVINKHTQDFAKHKKYKDTRQKREDYDYLDVEGNHVDSGETRLDRHGRPIEPMYHVLEEPKIPVSDTLWNTTVPHAYSVLKHLGKFPSAIGLQHTQSE